MKIFFPLTTLAVLALASCKKDRSHTSAEGVVIDATTQARVAGARVYLLQTKGTSLYASPSRVQYVTADNLGKYSLSFEAESDSRYDLQAAAPGFFDTPDNEYVGLSTGDKNKKNVPVRPEAWLRVRFLSQSPGVITGITLDGPDALPISISGKDIDATRVILCHGNAENRIEALIYAGGPAHRADSSIYCPAHDTTDYTIHF